MRKPLQSLWKCLVWFWLFVVGAVFMRVKWIPSFYLTRQLFIIKKYFRQGACFPHRKTVGEGIIKKSAWKVLFPILMLPAVACSFFVNVNRQAADVSHPQLTAVLFTTKTPVSTSVGRQPDEPFPAQYTPQPTPIPLPTLEATSDFRKLWAVEVTTDLDYVDEDYALGSPGLMDCGELSFHEYTQKPENISSEYYLNLRYEYALTPKEINMFFSGSSKDLLRVELLDSRSGLGVTVMQWQESSAGDCLKKISMQVDTDREVDTVILAFKNTETPVYIDAVELVGTLSFYADIPVFWRIPIPFDFLSDPDSMLPGGMAVDSKNTLFLANGRNGLLRFDVEGNLIKSYPVPSASYLSDVTIDKSQQIVVTDSVYEWVVILDEDGNQLITRGDVFGWNNPKAAAINPVDDNLYLLNTGEDLSRIRVYSTEPLEWKRDIVLEWSGEFAYKGLAFDHDGYLYTISIQEAAVIKIDPYTGEILKSLGYDVLARTSASDLAIDERGNIYVLLNSNPDHSAVLILDKQGSLVRRLGGLSNHINQSQEGLFVFPVSIAVTADGHFLFICENGYLTAYWLEP